MQIASTVGEARGNQRDMATLATRWTIQLNGQPTSVARCTFDGEPVIVPLTLGFLFDARRLNAAQSGRVQRGAPAAGPILASVRATQGPDMNKRVDAFQRIIRKYEEPLWASRTSAAAPVAAPPDEALDVEENGVSAESDEDNDNDGAFGDEYEENSFIDDTENYEQVDLIANLQLRPDAISDDGSGVLTAAAIFTDTDQAAARYRMLHLRVHNTRKRCDSSDSDDSASSSRSTSSTSMSSHSSSTMSRSTDDDHHRRSRKRRRGKGRRRSRSPTAKRIRRSKDAGDELSVSSPMSTSKSKHVQQLLSALLPNQPQQADKNSKGAADIINAQWDKALPFSPSPLTGTKPPHGKAQKKQQVPKPDRRSDAAELKRREYVGENMEEEWVQAGSLGLRTAYEAAVKSRNRAIEVSYAAEKASTTAARSIVSPSNAAGAATVANGEIRAGKTRDASSDDVVVIDDDCDGSLHLLPAAEAAAEVPAPRAATTGYIPPTGAINYRTLLRKWRAAFGAVAAPTISHMLVSGITTGASSSRVAAPAVVRRGGLPDSELDKPFRPPVDSYPYELDLQLHDVDNAVLAENNQMRKKGYIANLMRIKSFPPIENKIKLHLKAAAAFSAARKAEARADDALSTFSDAVSAALAATPEMEESARARERTRTSQSYTAAGGLVEGEVSLIADSQIPTFVASQSQVVVGGDTAVTAFATAEDMTVGASNAATANGLGATPAKRTVRTIASHGWFAWNPLLRRLLFEATDAFNDWHRKEGEWRKLVKNAGGMSVADDMGLKKSDLEDLPPIQTVRCAVNAVPR